MSLKRAPGMVEKDVRTRQTGSTLDPCLHSISIQSRHEKINSPSLSSRKPQWLFVAPPGTDNEEKLSIDTCPSSAIRRRSRGRVELKTREGLSNLPVGAPLQPRAFEHSRV